MFLYLEHGELPKEERKGRKIAAQRVYFVVLNDIYYIDRKCNNRKQVIILPFRRDTVEGTFLESGPLIL